MDIRWHDEGRPPTVDGLEASMNVIAGATAAGGKGWAGSLAAAMQTLAGLISAVQDDGRAPAAALLHSLASAAWQPSSNATNWR
jgi:hypothetical protein